MKLSSFASLATTAILATEACSAAPRAHQTQTANQQERPARVNTRPIEEPINQDAVSSSGKSSSEPAQEKTVAKAKIHQWGIDTDEDEKRIQELAEWLAAFSTSRYLECIVEAQATNPEPNAGEECVLTIVDEDKEKFITQDIPTHIQQDILAKTNALLDDFKRIAEEQREKVKKAFENLFQKIDEDLRGNPEN